ncbi:U3 snoRNP protein [Coniosporium apollinis]|uniref:U3 snoRNP protein n=1 Tax=Coniosporium apollinis TaxID=61459 RepID=A0ABQ9NU66_9PEZI|nr:U3 snoRNP protein [Coniosporium apollinis]
MAGASDKARFYLERSVPELHEYERKGIFSKEEITSIAKKRSDFEHVLNARASHPSDYARYATYEMNLEALRKKRINRLGIKAGGHAGQRRIFFILDRAVRKFPGDIGLWMQYIEFARAEKAIKKLNEILTSVLRMHPTKPELWTYAARYAFESQADMTNARSYMQRGLRFCRSSRALWLEYAKLEMSYVAKIAGRQHILGLDIDRAKKQDAAGDKSDADMITLPEVTTEDINPSLGKDDAVDETALQNLASTPALTGAIPMAIFDAAMKEFKDDPALGEQFFDVFAEFDQVPCTKKILQHVVDHMLQHSPNAIPTLACYFRLPIVGVDPASAAFPSALGQCLERIRSALKQSPQVKAPLAERAIVWLLPLLRLDELDPAVHKVMSSSLRQFSKALAPGSSANTAAEGGKLAGIVGKLEQDKRHEDAQLLLSYGSKQRNSTDRLLHVQASISG